eukprot:TRINITY_DN398_c0_g1_i11.p4 TRINITY_DN398_c0_g1~~TRINITY_DN398_c0_g1_i11.p4  ORF type:complete len:106 (+),score=12.77 TRINITY_DN398_c0_g1_i11:1067-1384(+)
MPLRNISPAFLSPQCIAPFCFVHVLLAACEATTLVAPTLSGVFLQRPGLPVMDDTVEKGGVEFDLSATEARDCHGGTKDSRLAARHKAWHCNGTWTSSGSTGWTF